MQIVYIIISIVFVLKLALDNNPLDPIGLMILAAFVLITNVNIFVLNKKLNDIKKESNK